MRANVHCGSDVLAKKILENGHDRILQYGIARDWKRNDVERLFRAMSVEGHLDEAPVINGSGFPSYYVRVNDWRLLYVLESNLVNRSPVENITCW